MKAVIEQNKAWIEETFQKLDQKLRVTTVRSKDKLVFTSVDGEAVGQRRYAILPSGILQACKNTGGVCL